MLDSVLESVMARHMPAIHRTPHGERHLRYEHHGYQLIPIPIERTRLGPWLIPLCSAPIFAPPGEETVTHMTKAVRPDPLLVGQLRKVQSDSGAYKSYRLPRRIRTIRRIVWFAVARPGAKGAGQTRSACNEIRRRLKEVKALGQDTNVGHGEVEQWEVEPWEHDWSWFAPHPDGGKVLMRPLPVGEWLPPDMMGAQPWFGRPCGPYWDRAAATEIVRPC